MFFFTVVCKSRKREARTICRGEKRKKDEEIKDEHWGH